MTICLYSIGSRGSRESGQTGRNGIEYFAELDTCKKWQEKHQIITAVYIHYVCKKTLTKVDMCEYNLMSKIMSSLTHLSDPTWTQVKDTVTLTYGQCLRWHNSAHCYLHCLLVQVGGQTTSCLVDSREALIKNVLVFYINSGCFYTLYFPLVLLLARM